MNHQSRRCFLGSIALASFAGAMLTKPHGALAQTEQRAPMKSVLYTSRIVGDITEEELDRIKQAGFDGVETTKWDVTPEVARKARLAAEKCDLRIQSVMRGWANFNVDNKFDEDLESVKKALRAAAAYGADAILLVPARIDAKPMPQPWEFDIEFDPKTLKVKAIVDGDNAQYADYIAAQNKATEKTIEAVEKLIPVAAKEGVRIALENVWNNLWCSPKFFAALFNHFDNPWVGCYFDMGNHLKYARCEEWLKALGHRIVKLHIKGYKVTERKGKLGGGVGNWCKLDEASEDWAAMRDLLSEIRYNGWITYEEEKYTEKEYADLLKKYFG